LSNYDILLYQSYTLILNFKRITKQDLLLNLYIYDISYLYEFKNIYIYK